MLLFAQWMWYNWKITEWFIIENVSWAVKCLACISLCVVQWCAVVLWWDAMCSGVSLHQQNRDLLRLESLLLEPTTYLNGNPGLNFFEVSLNDIWVDRRLNWDLVAVFLSVIPVKISVTAAVMTRRAFILSLIESMLSCSRDNVMSVQPLILNISNIICSKLLEISYLSKCYFHSKLFLLHFQ